MRGLIILAGIALGLAGLFFWAFNPSVAPTDLPAGEVASPEGAASAGGPGERRSVLDEARARRRAAEDGPSGQPEAAPEPELPKSPSPSEARRSPAEGLEVASISSADLRAAGVPDEWDSGVVVADVAPDSPADEARLLQGDIIVEVRNRLVRQPEDVAEIVGDNGYAKVTFVREGQVLQVVLRRPFPPDLPSSAR